MEVKYAKKLVAREEIVKSYVAFDGTAFTEAADCLEYEDTQKEMMLNSVETCTAADDYAPFDGKEHTDESSYYWFRPQNMQEVSTLNTCFPGLYIGEEAVGEWISIEIDSCNNAWMSYLNQCFAYAKELAMKLGYNLTVAPLHESKSNEDIQALAEQFSAAQKDSLYRYFWSQRVRTDVVEYCKSNDLVLTDQNIDLVVDRYVNMGDYDCNISYWDNIHNLVTDVSASEVLV